MISFDAVIRSEGSKGNARITVPATAVKLLRETGMHFPGWVRFSIAGFAPIYAVARFPISRPSVTITLPIWAFDLKIGTAVRATIEDATPFRIRHAGGEFTDWLTHVDLDSCFPTDEAGTLILNSRHEEPFRLLRRMPDCVWRLLGLYQAEGSKSENAPDWTMASSNPLLLASVPPMLEALGIPRERQYLEVLRGAGETPEAARKAFARVGLRVAAERVRPGAGGHAGVLHVSKSQPLLRLFKRALAVIFAEDWQWPSKVAAREYALGWLDGDGSIGIDPRSPGIQLRLAGYENEQLITWNALHIGIDMEPRKTNFGGVRSHTARNLTLHEAAKLAVAGGFTFSMNRARLLNALARRLETYHQHTQGGHQRTDHTDAAAAQILFNAHLANEEKALRHHVLASKGFITGIKGLPYPV